MSKLPPQKKICKFYPVCANGDKCPYQHLNQETQIEVAPSIKNVKPCTYFQLNQCSKGDKCNFSHILILPASTTVTETTKPLDQVNLQQQNQQTNQTHVPEEKKDQPKVIKLNSQTDPEAIKKLIAQQTKNKPQQKKPGAPGKLAPIVSEFKEPLFPLTPRSQQKATAQAALPLQETVKTAPVKVTASVPAPVATTDTKPPSEFHLELDDERESKLKLISLKKKMNVITRKFKNKIILFFNSKEELEQAKEQIAAPLVQNEPAITGAKTEPVIVNNQVEQIQVQTSVAQSGVESAQVRDTAMKTFLGNIVQPPSLAEQETKKPEIPLIITQPIIVEQAKKPQIIITEIQLKAQAEIFFRNDLLCIEKFSSNAKILGKRQKANLKPIIEEPATKKQKIEDSDPNMNPEGMLPNTQIVMPVIVGAVACPVQDPALTTNQAVNVSSSTPADNTPDHTAVKEQKKAMTQTEVMQMVDQFNQKLDRICQMYDLTVTEDDLRISQIPGVDNLLSFETKVNYICEFFNTKHLELTNVILNK